MTTTHAVSVELSNGQQMLVSAVSAEGSSVQIDGVPSFRDVVKVIEGIGEELKDAIAKVAPQKASVEFGVEIAAKEGALIGLLAKASGTATLTVTLEWNT